MHSCLKAKMKTNYMKPEIIIKFIEILLKAILVTSILASIYLTIKIILKT